MSSCDFCEREDDIRECDWCCHEVCSDHRHTLDGDELCAPPAPFQHNGCYKPPVTEVACAACDKPTSDLHADVPIHVECRRA